MLLDKNKPSSLQETGVTSLLLRLKPTQENTSVKRPDGPGGGVPNKLVTVVDRCPQKATNRMTPVLRGPRGKDGLCLSSR